MATRRLTEEEFQATFVRPMRDITPLAVRQADNEDEPGLEGGVLNIWPYVASVPTGDMRGRRIRPGIVELVYRSADSRWDHVLMPTDAKNVYLVVVVDEVRDRIHGHVLLDLNEKYGVKPGQVASSRALRRHDRS